MGKLGVPARMEPYRTQQGMSKYGSMLVQVSKLMDATTEPCCAVMADGLENEIIQLKLGGPEVETPVRGFKPGTVSALLAVRSTCCTAITSKLGIWYLNGHK